MPAPAIERPLEGSFGGPGAPRAGSGRSQERHRNFELSREARTEGFVASLSLLFSPRLFGDVLPLIPFEISAASL